MSFLSSLEEQAVVGFTGRINILHREKREYLGAVLFQEGNIVNSFFQGECGKRTLYHIFMDDLEKKTLSFIVEPEIISLKDSLFTLAMKELKREIQKFYSDYSESKKLRPPADMKVLLNSDFIVQGPEIRGIEFDVMDVMAEFSKVRDIYKNLSDYRDYEITNALVRLRKIKALKVLA